MPVGFHNTGTICWLNSILQAMVSSSDLCSTIKNIDQTNASDLLLQLIDLIKKIDEHVDIQKKSIDILQTISHTNLIHGQQASDEGFIILLDLINNKEICNLFTHIYEIKLICKQTNKILSKERSINNIFYMFDERILEETNLTTCILGYTHNLEDYTPQEHMSYHKKHYKYKRVYKLRRIPEIVIICLNRYRTTGKGNIIARNNKIKLPQTFNIPDIDNKAMVYDKIAEIDHLGSLNSGHYICRAKRNNKIYLFNDIRCTEYRLETLPSTFLTFYQRLK